MQLKVVRSIIQNLASCYTSWLSELDWEAEFKLEKEMDWQAESDLRGSRTGKLSQT